MPAPALSTQQLTDFRADGFTVVRGLFSPEEAGAWQRECDRLWDRADVGSTDRVQWRQHRAGAPVPDRFDPVIDASPVFARLTRDPRIVQAVEAALGGPAVLFKDKLIAKRPGTAGYGLHQDYPYWTCAGIGPDALLSVQVSIDPADAANGALEVFPGLHHAQLPSPPGEPRDVDESALDLSRGQLVESRPGDLLLFHSFVPHRSGPNTSGQSRRALFLTYARTEDEGVYARYYAGRPAY